MTDAFRLTSSPRPDPSPALHARYAAALVDVRTTAGAEHPMLIDGRDVRARLQVALRSPADLRCTLGRFQAGDATHAAAAVTAAARAFSAWSACPWTERVALLRRAAALLEARVGELAAVLALEIGAHRVDALAEAQAAARLLAAACDRMEAGDGDPRAFAPGPGQGGAVERTHVYRPWGPWIVIAPFCLPLAFAAGAAGAALVAGNTVVCKAARATPWSLRLLALALRDAGLPGGTFNAVTGPGGVLGQALVGDARAAGLSFAGSAAVGMHVLRSFAEAPRPRPGLVATGGGSAAVVSRHADLRAAASGVARSAFALAGQRGTACARVYVEHTVVADCVAALHALTVRIAVGDPARGEAGMGPVVDAAAVARYEDAVAQVHALGADGAIVAGGRRLDESDHAHGYFLAPTIARVPPDHPLWRRDLGVPLVLVAPVETIDEGFARAGAGGCAAGFYGTPAEAERFFAATAAAAAYANAPQGATSGAWPDDGLPGGWDGPAMAAEAPLDLARYQRGQWQTRGRPGA